MTDIAKLRELLARSITGDALGQDIASRDIRRELPALLDELERLRLDKATNDHNWDNAFKQRQELRDDIYRLRSENKTLRDNLLMGGNEAQL